MNKNSIQIVIADDNNFFCDALKDNLNSNSEFNVIATFTDLDSLINYTNVATFDLLILDVNFNGISSLDYISQIRKDKSKFKIISLTTLNNNYIKQQIAEKNIDYFVGKDSDLSQFKEHIFNCLENKNELKNDVSKKIKVGHFTFTKRKIEVLQALYKHSNKNESEIAAILNISENSLKSHKRELFEITNTKSTPELIKFGIQKGLIIA